MIKKFSQVLYKIYFLLFVSHVYGQNEPLNAPIVKIEFRLNITGDSLFYNQTIEINNKLNHKELIFNIPTSSVSSALNNNESFIESLSFDNFPYEISKNDFHSIPIPEGTNQIQIKGHYVKIENSNYFLIDQNYIPRLSNINKEAGATLDYLRFPIPLKTPIQLKMFTPSNYGVNLVYSSKNSYFYPDYKEGKLILHPAGYHFDTRVQIETITYDIHIVGDKRDLNPFKFEQIQKLTLWMHEHYGEANDKKIILKMDDFIQSVFTNKGFKYYNKYLNFKLIEQVSNHWIQSVQLNNDHDRFWFKNGFSRYNQGLFLKDFGINDNYLYPEHNHPITHFFDLQDLDFRTLQFYEYWINAVIRADIGFDQDIEHFSKLNYTTLSYAKAGLLFNHLSNSSVNGSIDQFIRNCIKERDKVDLKSQLFTEFGTEGKWFYSSLSGTATYDDFYIKESHVVKDSLYIEVYNRGNGSYPIKLSLLNDSSNFDLWIPAFDRDTVVTLKNEGWKSIHIDPDGSLIEMNKRNNLHKIHSWKVVQNLGKFRLQPFLSLYNPYKRQAFVFPSFRWNNYDKSILGLSFNNRSFPLMNTQYRIVPEYSTSTGKLIGNGGLKTNVYFPNKQFNRIELSGYYKKNHYDFDLDVERYSFGLKSFLKPSHRGDARLRYLNLKSISISAEPAIESVVEQPQDYSVISLSYHHENRKVNKPYFFSTEVQWSPDFMKIQTDFLIKFRTFSHNKNNSLRLFVGKLFELNKDIQSPSYYDFGLSNSNDYLFENLLLGRSDNSGIWSRQFFVNDGGFKTLISNPINEFLLSANLQLNIWGSIGFFGDIAIVDRLNNAILWDTGLRLQVVDEFLELYFPIKSSSTNEFQNERYLDNIRFVLNLDVDDMFEKFRTSF